MIRFLLVWGALAVTLVGVRLLVALWVSGFRVDSGAILAAVFVAFCQALAVHWLLPREASAD